MLIIVFGCRIYVMKIIVFFHTESMKLRRNPNVGTDILSSCFHENGMNVKKF